MDLGGLNLNPQDLLQYLQGIDWPANKQEVVGHAESNGAPQDLLEQLRNNLQGGRYSGPEEVLSHLQGGGRQFKRGDPQGREERGDRRRVGGHRRRWRSRHRAS